ncbi:MAG: hypothetical protein ABIH23_32775 [bacterium]
MDRFYLFGFNEKTLLGDGWYDPERLEGGPPFRATSARARLVLPKCRLDEVVIVCRAHTRITGQPLRVTLRDPWEQRTPVTISSDAWHVRRYVPPSQGHIVDYLDIMIENPWSPSRVLGSNDRRLIGLLVAAVRLSIRQ